MIGEETFELVAILGTGARRMQRKSGRAGILFSGIVLAAAAFLVVAVGCSSKPTPSSPGALKPAGSVLKVACPGDPPAAVVERYGARWASQQGVRIEVVRYDPAQGPQSAGGADIWVLPTAQMPRWAARGELHAVPETYTARSGQFAWENMLPNYREKLLVWDDKVYALPLLGEEWVCFYRADLLAEAAHQQAFQAKYGRPLAPPTTWEDFADVAEYFHQQKGSASLPPPPESDEDLDRLFYAVAVPFVHRAVRDGDPKRPPDVEIFSCHYDCETGAIRIATPGFVHALQLLQRLQRYGPAGPVREPPRSFQDGQAVLCLASPAWIARFQSSPAVEGKFGLCRVPGSARVFDYETGAAQDVPGGNHVPYLGAAGWLAVVPRSAAHAEMAFALLADLSSPKTSRDIVIEPSWGGGVFRQEHFQYRGGWQAFGLNPGLTETLVETLRQTVATAHIINPVLRLRIPDEHSHQQALVAEVRAALSGAKEPRAALAAAAERWNQLAQRKDLKLRLTEYRLSIGLRPRS